MSQYLFLVCLPPIYWIHRIIMGIEKKGVGGVSWVHGREFKYEAMRLMNEGKRSVRDIAKDLDIHPNLLHQWRRTYRADVEHAFPGKGHMRPPEEEIRRLQRENEYLREEKEILKKSLAIFSKHPR
jgi:transposase